MTRVVFNRVKYSDKTDKIILVLSTITNHPRELKIVIFVMKFEIP